MATTDLFPARLRSSVSTHRAPAGSLALAGATRENDGRWPPSRSLLVGLVVLVGLIAFCADRIHNGDFYLQLLGGRFVAHHGFSLHDPFPTIDQGRPWLNGQWLAELVFYYVARLLGFAGVAAAYAGVLALGGGILLWAIRRKGTALLLAAAVAYTLGLATVVHPRPAGFTLAAFCALVVLLAWAANRPHSERRSVAVLVGVPASFALWANLHGGFLAGLLLICLYATGLSIDLLRGRSTDRHLILLAVGSGLLSIVAVTVATPLGPGIWSYITSFHNPEIGRISTEWGAAYHSPSETLYVSAAATFAAWLWWRSPAPRRTMPALVTVGFICLAILAARNLIFVAPGIVFLALCTQPDRPVPGRSSIAKGATAAAIACALVVAAVLGPAHDAKPLGSPLVSYAIAHPPKSGRIASYAGVGSYILWRSPHTAVVLNGWLEHFSSRQLGETYAILDNRRGSIPRLLRRLDVGAVIASRQVTVRALESHGFIARFVSREGAYLVRAGY